MTVVAPGTVYTDTLVDASTYSSGAIDITGLSEVIIFIHVTAATLSDYPIYAQINLSRIDPFGNVSLWTPIYQVNGGTSLPSFPVDQINSFTTQIGNTIQLDLTIVDSSTGNPATGTVSMQISVIGK